MNLTNMPPEVRAFRRDLAKCEGVGCPIREQCGRFTRPAVDGQQWVLGFYGATTTWVGDGLLVEPKQSCRDHQPIGYFAPEVLEKGPDFPSVQAILDATRPFGGAPEEGDGC